MRLGALKNPIDIKLKDSFIRVFFQSVWGFKSFQQFNESINESTLKTDSIAKIRLDHCIKTITYVSDGIGNPPF
jgi:hypothetical protein